MKVDAMFYENKGDYLVCNLCPNNCIFKDESFGICTVRVKEKSKLKSINYGEVSSIGLDPIEKSLYFIINLKNIYYLLEALDAILSVAFAKTTQFQWESLNRIYICTKPCGFS